jgi:hypothetical protein
LQGESKPIPSSHETRSTEPQRSSSTDDKTEQVLNNRDALFKHIKASMPGLNDQELLASLKVFMKDDHGSPPSSPVTTTVTPSLTSAEKSTAIISPIPSVTPISTSFDVPSSEVIHLDELTPISPEEMPPSSFFFNKKRKAIIRKESHQKGGVTTKKHIIVYDGHEKNDPEFAKEVVDSLGAFATANQWSVGIFQSNCKKSLSWLNSCRMKCRAQNRLSRAE